MTVSKSEINQRQLDAYARTDIVVLNIDNPAATTYDIFSMAPFGYTLKAVVVKCVGGTSVTMSFTNDGNTVNWDGSTTTVVATAGNTVLQAATSGGSNLSLLAGDALTMTVAVSGSPTQVSVQLMLERAENVSGTAADYPNDVDAYWASLDSL